MAACLAVGLDALRLEVMVDDTTELDFDRCAAELELVGIATAAASARLAGRYSRRALMRAASQEIVHHMTRMQAYAAGPPCAAAPLPRSTPPVWTWADARALAAQGKLRLNFGGGAANDFHAFDDRRRGGAPSRGLTTRTAIAAMASARMGKRAAASRGASAGTATRERGARRRVRRLHTN